MRVWRVDIHPVLHKEMNHFIMTCADGIVKSCNTITVRFTRIVHLGGRGKEDNYNKLFISPIFLRTLKELKLNDWGISYLTKDLSL